METFEVAKPNVKTVNKIPPDSNGDVHIELGEAIPNETIAEIIESDYVPSGDAVPLTTNDIDTVF